MSTPEIERMLVARLDVGFDAIDGHDGLDVLALAGLLNADDVQRWRRTFARAREDRAAQAVAAAAIGRGGAVAAAARMARRDAEPPTVAPELVERVEAALGDLERPRWDGALDLAVAIGAVGVADQRRRLDAAPPPPGPEGHRAFFSGARGIGAHRVLLAPAAVHAGIRVIGIRVGEQLTEVRWAATVAGPPGEPAARPRVDAGFALADDLGTDYGPPRDGFAGGSTRSRTGAWSLRGSAVFLVAVPDAARELHLTWRGRTATIAIPAEFGR